MSSPSQRDCAETDIALRPAASRRCSWSLLAVALSAAMLAACGGGGGGGGGGTAPGPGGGGTVVVPPPTDVTPASAPSYDKIGASGELLASGATSFDCVRDRSTGLYWDVKAASAVYSTFADAQASPAAANAANRCGRSNWRLPEVYELAFQTDVSRASSPVIDTNFFPQHLSRRYWSATDRNLSAGDAWIVDFNTGSIGFLNKVQLAGSDFRAVNVSGDRALADCNDSLFVDNGDSTVTDRRTGLMWAKCTDGRSGANCGAGAATTYTWNAAVLRPATANSGAGFLGHTDWRLPNQREMASLARPFCANPATNATRFPATELTSYWTISTALSGTAWSVNFVEGEVGPSPTADSKPIRLVRTTP